MKDTLDIMNPRSRYSAEGRLYDARPEVRGGGIPFYYSYESQGTQAYARLFGNVQGLTSEIAIRTNDALDYTVNQSYVELANGDLYKITGIMKDYTTNPQILRLFGEPVSVSYVLRLLQEYNPWGVKQQ